ncbi:hypothetical protein MNBD_IGNAVI01-1637 [hydrothermal vent metagenome]|uniref:Uncharacterized protein n=1 Tax=hydrothermal vent metagenome TaxID=652676 RepID=A0A3B1DEZ1_9ZZZZ
MKKDHTDNFKMILIISSFIFISFTSFSIAQNKKSAKSDSLSQPKHSHQRNVDPRYSVFGPPKPALWKFQLGHMNRDNERVSAVTLYKKNQRDKTLFFTILNNSLDNTYQYRVNEISGGIILFPFNNDDRYQFDLGGTFDMIQDTSLYNATFFSRFTWRPNRSLWMRAGFEYYDGHELGHGGNLYGNSTLNSYYLAAKYKIGFFSPVAVAGGGKADRNINNRLGAGILLDGPFETYVFGGYIRSTDATEDTRTLAIGRWAPFRPDGLPSAFFIWKHRSDYDFQLGGIFFGRRNRFVRPAAVGMLTGMFVSSITLRVNSQLRQRKLMMITDDYENSDFSFYYVHLNQKITPTNNAGFSVLQLFKLFTDTEFWIFSQPVIGVFYNEETNPTAVYNPDTHQMEFGDETETYWSYQVGSRLFERFMFNIIYEPSRYGWTLTFSYLYF